jgi:hypothetical protein
MSKTRVAILLTMAVSLLLLGAAVAQPGEDRGEYVILNAQYGSERNHIDVTERLKFLARQDRPFRVTHDSMNADPDEGHSKVLRVFARGPNGQERMFEYRDGAVFEGAMFRSWRRADWGDAQWRGGWNGSGNDGDRGEFVILSAQYGSERRHVDVTPRLRELARRDMTVRLDFRTFGVDPDEGHAKVLRIYARGPNGRERMFEFRDGSVIDGSRFRAWGRGEWGNGNERWSGRWEGEERDDRDDRR